MMTKCLVEQEEKGLIHRTQYNTIPPKVEYRLTEQGKMLLLTLNALYTWAEQRMQEAFFSVMENGNILYEAANGIELAADLGSEG